MLANFWSSAWWPLLRLIFTALPGRFAEEGCRRSAYAALVVSSHKHPHILVLQSSSGAFRLPGGRLRPGEEEADGLKRQLQSLLAPAGALLADWEVGELLGTWRGPGLTKLCPAFEEAAPCDRCRDDEYIVESDP